VNLDSALVSTAELAGVKRTLSPQISESPIHPTIQSRAVTAKAPLRLGRYLGAAAAVLVAAVFIAAMQWSNRGVMVEIVSASGLLRLHGRQATQ